MLDVKQWRDYLDYVIAVENDPDAVGLMILTAGEIGIGGITQILQGDVESVLIDWQDENGDPPAKKSFDIVNLDFLGGFIGFGGISDDRRVNAFRELFRRQAMMKNSFILFLTVGFRESKGQEYDYKLHHIEKELRELGIDAEETLGWYLSHPTKHKIKVYIPFLIDEIAIANRFHLKKHMCFYYKGSGDVPMMHFAFDFEYSSEYISPQRLSLVSVLDCPLFMAYPHGVEPCTSRPPQVRKGSK